MDIAFNEGSEIKQFIIENRNSFEHKLLSEAVNVAAKINEILDKGNIDLLKNAQKLVLFIVEDQEKELVSFAEQEGVAWAKHSLTLAFKLEWIQAIRRTIWHFLYEFDKLKKLTVNREDFYIREKRINDKVDQFLNNFFISYSNFKDGQLASQRKLVEHLSVPIIPITRTVAVLPLIGLIDDYRMTIIEGKVLNNIAALQVETLIIDLSGVAEMDLKVMDHFQKVLSGISMMGSRAVITGLRPELVRKMIHLGVSFDKNAEASGTLQQTLSRYLVHSPTDM